MPECRINLSHAVCYLATSLKSNATYMAVESALKDVREGRTLPVPRHLRDANHKAAAKQFGHKGYQYAHNSPDAYLPQEYLPDQLRGMEFYRPGGFGHEKKIAERLEWWAKLKRGESASGE